MSEQFYLDKFNEHRDLGMRQLDAGDLKEARYNLIKAAEYLYKLAQISRGRLQQVRFENANKLMEMVRNIEANPAQYSKRKEARSAEGSSGTGQDEREKDTAAEWVVREKPNIRFSDIAGLEDVKEQIRVKMIYPFVHTDKAEKYGIRKGGGILLYGPPGTGKTMLGKAVACELDAPFFLIKPSDILSKWVGESEKNIARLFDETRKYDKAIIFIDEVEAIVPRRREMQHSVMQRVVPQILAEMDGFEQRKNSLLFLGATNEPWEIDYAMMRPGRLDEKIYVGLPDEPARRAILTINLKNAPLAPDVDLGALARLLDGYSGADIAYLCRKVRETVFLESVEKNTDRPISMSDFQTVLRKMGPSVEPKDLIAFEKFRQEMVK